MHFSAETQPWPTPPALTAQRQELPTSPPLHSQLGSSNLTAYAPAKPTEASVLASRQLLHVASHGSASSDAAIAGSAAVRDPSTLPTRAPPGLPQARPDTSTGLESHVHTLASAPLGNDAHRAPTAGRGPDGRHVMLPLPRLVGLPVSSPNALGSLLQNHSVHEDSWRPSGHRVGSLPTSVAAATSAPIPKPFSDEKISFGAVSSAMGPSGFGPRLSQLPLLYSPPIERAPSAALSLLAETSNEQPPLQLGRKRSREPPIVPLLDHPEKAAPAVEPRKKTATRVLREIPASSVHLNPRVAGLPVPLATVQARKSATSEPVQFTGPVRTPSARPSSSDDATCIAHEPWQGTTAASRPPPPAELSLPSMGLPVSRNKSVDAAHDAINPLLAHEAASRLPIVQAQAHLETSGTQLADPGTSLEAAPLAAQLHASGPAHSTRPATPRSSVARSTFEPKAPEDQAQVLWLCDRCDRPYKWKQTLQAHRRYVRSGLSESVGQLS